MKKAIVTIPLFFLCFSFAQDKTVDPIKVKTVDRILVQVNEEIITLSELNREMKSVRKELESKYSGEELEQMLQKAEKDVLENLITHKLVYQKAIELGIDSNDIDSRISAQLQQDMKEFKLKDMDELEAALENQGTSLKEYRENYRKRIIADDLIGGMVGSRITVLTPEIEKYYQDHLADYTSEEEITLSELILNTDGSDKETEQRANDLYKRLLQGESFKTLVSQYSKGASASKGGLSGTYLLSKLNADTVNAISNLKEGEMSKPQKIKEGYIIYHIDARKLPTVRPLEEVKGEIKNIIMNRKYTPELNRYITQLREDSYIQIYSEIK
jgi:peptidyl-prolyl cis-trans isomerase SurA